MGLRSDRYASLQKWLPVVLHEPLHRRYQNCDNRLERQYIYNSLLSFLVFNVDETTAKLVQFIKLQQQYRLCGIVYFGNFQFTSQCQKDHQYAVLPWHFRQRPLLHGFMTKFSILPLWLHTTLWSSPCCGIFPLFQVLNKRVGPKTMMEALCLWVDSVRL